MIGKSRPAGNCHELPYLRLQQRKRFVLIKVEPRLRDQGRYEIGITFILQVARARRQRRDLLVFESSYHLPTGLPHAVDASH